MTLTLDSTLALTGADDGFLKIANITTGKGEITCLKWLDESKYVASGCSNAQIIIWDTRSGERAMTFNGHSKKIQEFSVSANQDFLVSASDDGAARVFDISSFR